MHNRIQLLHIIEAFGGGTLTSLSNLCCGVRQSCRHSIAYGLRPETPSDFTRLFPPETQFHAIPMRRAIDFKSDAAAFRQLTALIRTCKPDVIHCHSSKAGVLGRLAARLHAVPSVYTPHAYCFLRTDIGVLARCTYRTIEWLCSRVGDVIATCGDEEYALARALHGHGDVRLVRNAVDCDAMRAVIPYDWGAGLPVAGICGRYSPQHRPDLFYALAERLRDACRWVWIGDEATRRPTASVQKIGWLPREEVLTRIAGLDIYIHTSSWEGLSCSILEAMALGKPVVACDIPPNRAVVEHGVTGFLGTDADELTAGILRLARDPALRATMGENARQRIAQRYDIRAASQTYAALYHELAAGKPGVRHG